MKAIPTIGLAAWLAMATAGPANAKDPRLDASTPASRAAFLCLTYGEGFLPLPGTNTCVRAGGDIEAGVLSSRLSNPAGVRSGKGGRPVALSAPGASARARTGSSSTRAFGRAAVEFESQTPIENGTITTHVRIENLQQSGR